MGTNKVRIGALSKAVGLHVNWLRKLTDDGTIPSERSSGGQRFFDVEMVRAALEIRATRARSQRGVGVSVSEGKPAWERTYPLLGLEEDLVWSQVVKDLVLNMRSPAADAMPYAFSEMLNNAIDHSDGTFVTVKFWANEILWAFEILDDGCGVFANLMKGLGLNSLHESLQELSKGKRTTAPEGHTGEGIFFTSKAVDLFQLASDGIRWTVDNARGDFAVGEEPKRPGTRVFAKIDAKTTRLLSDLFREFSKDHKFVRTRPTLKLFELGVAFVSRSEARRILEGLDDFSEIEIDFTNVEDVGQGFVDEMLRVWPSTHPDKKVIPINMLPAVRFMVERGMPT